MKRVTLISILAFVLVSCNAPRTKKAVYKSSNLTQSNTENSPNSNVDTKRDDPIVTQDGTTTDRENTLAIPEEIKHCSWSQDGVSGFSTSSNHIGTHTLCQSSTNKNDLYIQVKNAITNDQVCFVPTYISGNKSIYIGNPKCLTLPDTKKIYKVTVESNRPGYGNFTVNGVMVMKDKMHFYESPFNQWALTPDAYIFCSQFLDQYNDDRYCQAFKSKGEYLFKSF